MGSGSSVPEAPAKVEDWLRQVIEKERKEKAWLAKRYAEESEKADELRSELEALRRLLPGSTEADASAVQRPTTPNRLSKPGVIQKAVNDVHLMSTTDEFGRLSPKLNRRVSINSRPSFQSLGSGSSNKEQ
ncbi:unnamed protein product [Symbiodinium sp. CCMP2592]|nr:unnamed protein product [Symbiodinium sp. CCMP2592]